jgi:hypothetical protein
MTGKKSAPCSLGAGTARDYPFAAATDTLNLSSNCHSGGTANRLQIALLMNARGLTEAQAHGMAMLIWGAW